MSDAFSSDSEAVIRRVVSVARETGTPVDQLHELYQMKETCDFINEGHFEKVRSFEKCKCAIAL